VTGWHVAAAVLPVLVAETGLLVRDALADRRAQDQRIKALETKVAELERKTGCLR